MRVTFGWGFGVAEWFDMYPRATRLGLLDDSRLSW
jgi:hypothetical protein